MPFSEPIHVSQEAFDKAVLQSSLPVIVEFWAPWCSHCREIAPTLERVAKEYAGKILVAKVNADDTQELTQRLGVGGLPTLLFISHGQEVDRQRGALPEPALLDKIRKFLISSQVL